jgi:hypothetical protein
MNKIMYSFILETALQGMMGRLIEVGRCCGLEMIVDKTQVMIITRQLSPSQTDGSKKDRRILKISTIWVARLQVIQDVDVILNTGLTWQKQHEEEEEEEEEGGGGGGGGGEEEEEEEEDSLHQQFGLKVKDERGKMFYLEHGFVCCRNLISS